MMDSTQGEVKVIDESSLRQYFRHLLDVAPGVGRKQLRQSRDRLNSRLRERLGQAQGAERAHLENLIEQVNSAFECLTNNERFSEYLTRVNHSGSNFDLERVPEELNTKPKEPPRRQVERRQAHTQERMERISALIAETIATSSQAEARRLTTGKLPESDAFYETIYAHAKAAGQALKVSEIAQAEKSGKYDIDEHCIAELDAFIEDKAEIAAGKEYDRLEYMAAQLPEPHGKSRIVAASLTVIILLLVGYYAWFAMSQGPVLMKQEGVTASTLSANDIALAESQFEAGVEVPAIDKLTCLDKMVSTAGFAGIAGVANDLGKPGAQDYQKGIKLVYENNYNGALECFEKASKSKEVASQSYYCKGVLYGARGQIDDALNAYSLALINNPNFVQALYNRALCHQITGSLLLKSQVPADRANCMRNLQSALNNYKLALKLDPRLAQAHFNLGWVNYCLGRTTNAIQDFGQCSELSTMVPASDYNKNVLVHSQDTTGGVTTPLTVGMPPAPVGPVGPAGPQ
ncbi:MAG: tetratricopeptide repeat protein [Candidatus Obscuribacter sp.]|nr:tetratricopeptide repeat protein [Candidatus Obscuribacter sp.]